MSSRSWRIKRTVWGYRTAAARMMLSAFEERCAEEEQRLIGRVQELRAGNLLLRQAAVAAGLEPAAPGLAGPDRPGAGQPAGPGIGEPALHALGMTLFGYDPADLRRLVDGLRERWTARLGKLGAEAAGLEAERASLLALVGSGLSLAPRIAAAVGDPVQEMAAAVTVVPALPPADRAVPLRPPAALRLAVAGSPAAKPALQRGWRPGAVEEEEGSRAGVEGLRRGGGGGGRILPAYQPQAGPAPEPESPAVPSPRPPDGDQVETGVRQRLQLLFQRFLAGKVLGEELVTADGEILAAKGAEITRDLVQKAEAAGLLPSLIAQMTLPGIAEEQEVRGREPGRPVRSGPG